VQVGPRGAREIVARTAFVSLTCKYPICPLNSHDDGLESGTAMTLDLRPDDAESPSRPLSPWASLSGAVWVGDATTADEAVDIAGLDWEVRMDKPVFVVSEGEFLKVPNTAAIVRLGDPHRALAVVTDAYRPIQNRVALGVIDDIMKAEGLSLQWAGENDGGRRVFLTAKSPTPLFIAGEEIDVNYAVLSSHDGSAALRFSLVPIRRRTGSPLVMSFPTVERQMKVRHTSTAEPRAGSIREQMPMFRDYLQKFVDQAQLMDAAPMSSRQLADLVQKLFSYETDRMSAVIEDVNDFFMRERRTHWGAYCAVVRWMDVMRPVRGSRGRADDELRAMRMLEDGHNREKDKAAEYLRRMSTTYG